MYQINVCLVFLLITTVLSGVPEKLIVKNVIHDALSDILNELKNSSSNCAKNILYMLDKKNFKQGWPLRMLDASSKVPSGLMSGNIADLGSFDQCIAIEQEFGNDIIKGTYCKASIPLKDIKDIISQINGDKLQSRGVVNLASANPSLSLAVCLPNSCTAEEINTFLNISNALISNSLNIRITNCQTSDSESFNAGDWTVLIFLIIIVVIIILSTTYDVYIQQIGKDPAHLILVAFSFYTNGKKLLTVTKTANQLPCLHGMRFISMMWVVVGHTYYTAFFSPSINAIDTLSWMENYSSMYILGATVSVDTFFVLGGLLMSYVYLSAKDKGIKFNVIMYYIHRYIRLTPALAVAIMLHVTLLRFFGSGPYWPEVLKYLEINCSKYWWSSLLYVQNYVNPSEICISQTWYLSVDMQIFILSPLVLIPLGNWPHITIPVLGFIILISMAVPFTIAYIYNIPGLLSAAFKNPDFNHMYYVNTYTRFGPVIVGLVLGYFVYNRKKYLKFNSLFKNLLFKAPGWIISVFSLIMIVFEPSNMYFHDYNKIESSMYVGVHRVAWSLALCWIIYACIIGHGGIINTFLSLPLFQVLSRLTYSMYLIHLSLQTMKVGLLRVPIHFGNFENMYNFWGDFCLTAFAGFIWTLAFESPMITIEKIIFKSTSKKTPMDKALSKVTTNL